MTDIELFTYRDADVRTVLRDDEPWFIVADVCAVLDIDSPSSALRRLDDDEHDLVSIPTPNGRQVSANAVNEPGLYSLILGSRKPEAREFKRWVTHEVLPRIRRTGRYEVAPARAELSPRQWAEMVIAEADRADTEAAGRQLAEAKVAELAPAAHSWTVLADASGDYDLRNAAQILSRDRAIKIGQNQLADLLRELRWVDTRNRRPYQAQINIGRLAVRIRTWEDPETGEPRNSYQPRITPKGLEFLHRHLGGVEPLGPGQQLVLVDPAS